MFCFILLLTFSFSFLAASSQQWCPAGTGMKADAGGGVYTMAVYNSNLYAAGWFYQAGSDSVANIAQWNGSTWSPVGTGLSGGYSNVLALGVYNGKLYAGGAFYAAGDSATTDIAVWDGSNWSTVGTGMTTCTSSVTWVDAFAVYNGKLYAAGIFCKAGGITANNIAVWDGSKWDSVGAGINGSVSALCVYNGNLYAGGQFSKAGDTAANSIAMWDGTKWSPVAKGIRDSAVLAMAVYKGSLYVGGNFDSAGTVAAKNIAQWNGTTWSQVSAKGITGVTGVGTLCTYDTCLFAGGYFNNAGGMAVKSIARWNSVAWDTLNGGGINHVVNALVVYDTILYAGGLFSIAGNRTCADIAEWGNPTAGIDDLRANSEEVRVYPNPSKGVYAFEIRNYELGIRSRVEVYNVLGEKIFTASLNPSEGGTSTTIISLPFGEGKDGAGIYLYRLISEDGSLIGSGKLVKE
jgi:hypothetical protein